MLLACLILPCSFHRVPIDSRLQVPEAFLKEILAFAASNLFQSQPFISILSSVQWNFLPSQARFQAA